MKLHLTLLDFIIRLTHAMHDILKGKIFKATYVLMYQTSCSSNAPTSNFPLLYR